MSVCVLVQRPCHTETSKAAHRSPPNTTNQSNSDQILLFLLDTAPVASALRQAGLAPDKVKAAIEKLRAGKKVESAKAEQNYEARDMCVDVWCTCMCVVVRILRQEALCLPVCQLVQHFSSRAYLSTTHIRIASRP